MHWATLDLQKMSYMYWATLEAIYLLRAEVNKLERTNLSRKEDMIKALLSFRENTPSKRKGWSMSIKSPSRLQVSTKEGFINVFF